MSGHDEERRPADRAKRRFALSHAAAATSCLALISFAIPAGAATSNAVWIGGVGLYAQAANWNPDVVPNNGAGVTYHVLVDNNPGTASSVSQNSTRTIDTLTLNAGDSFFIENSRQLNIDGTAITNSGTLGVRSAGSVTILRLRNEVTLTGGGMVTLLAENRSEILSSVSSSVFHNVDNTIRGQGLLGVNTMGLDNQGLIQADVATRTLAVNVNAAGLRNRGVMQASGGGILRLEELACTNVLGSIRAATGSRVELHQATIFRGGMTAEGAGSIRVTANSALDAVNLFGNGILDIMPGTILSVEGADFQPTGLTTRVHGELSVETGRLARIRGGVLTGNGVVNGPVRMENGLLAPGDPLGLLSLLDSFEGTSTARFKAELGGLDVGMTYDHVMVTHTARLAGTLEVELVDSFIPRDGDRFTLLSAGTVQGEFDTSLLPDQGPLAFWNLNYSSTNVVLEFRQAEADLRVSQAASEDPVYSGSNLVYTITVTNSGPSNAFNVVLTDTLPKNIDSVVLPPSCTVTNGIVTCPLGGLPAGAATNVFLEVVVGVNSTGTLTNIVVVMADPYDTVPSNNGNTLLTSITPSDFDMDGMPDFMDPDDDNDGMPDEYENGQGLNAFDPADAGQDDDGDGLTNLEEYIALTNPHDSNSVFRIVSFAGYSVIDVGVESRSERIYTLQGTDAIAAEDFQDVAGQVDVAGNGSALLLVDSNGVPARIYRVVVEIP